jgi:hypothetical protein
MKFSNPEDLEKWKKAIEALEIIIPIAEQDANYYKKFYSNELEVAQFWKRYASERTKDAQLRKIAESNLQVVLMFETQLDSLVPTMFQDAVNFLKNNFSATT